MFPQIHIQFLVAHLWLWLAAGMTLCVCLSLWAYRRTLPPLSKTARILMAGLRFLALALILVVLLQPVVQLRRVFARPQIVGLLWDGSRSMQLPDRGTIRSDILKQLYTSDAVKSLDARTRTRHFLFSDRLDSIPPHSPDALSFLGSATDLAATLSAFQKDYANRKVGAVIVFSDGRLTQGTDPARVGGTSGFPVYTVTVGDSAEKPDIVLYEVAASLVAYVDNALPVEAILRAPNLGGRSAEVQLRSNGEILARKTVALPSGSEEKRVAFTFTPTEPGFQKLEVAAVPLEDELTEANNRREITIHVLKRKMSVLLLAGAPHPDVGFFRRMLARDPDVNLIVRTIQRGGGFYEGSLPSPSDLDDFDLFMLHDFPTTDVSERDWASIRRTVLEKEKPLFLIAGKHMDFSRLSTLQSRLPIFPPKRRDAREVQVRLTAEGGAHPVLQADESRAENIRDWERLPSLYSGWTQVRARDGAAVLAETAEPDRRGEELFILAFQPGNVKSLAVMGEGLYRWDLMMQGVGEGNALVTGFVQKAFRWLVLRESSKPVRVATDKRVYRAGENVAVTVQAVDGLSNPISDAQIQGALETSKNREPIRFSPNGSGQYSAAIRSFDEGDGRIVVEASRGDESFGRDTTGFTISRFTPEFLDTRSDPSLMRALAEATGGRSVSPDSLSAFLSAMDFPPETVERVREFEPLHSAWVLGVILFLLSVEWFLRKRRGLP